MARKTPEINGSSMADIAFLLLIFFLVTTTMDVDSGIYRKLPDWFDNEQTPPPINKRNVLSVLVNRDNVMAVEGQPTEVSELKDKVIDFILNVTNDPNKSTRKPKDIPLLGVVDVSDGIISLQNDRGTSYEMYIAVQDQLTAAFQQIREMRSQEKWGRKLTELTEEQYDAIRKWVPTAISEAEPKNTSQNTGK